MTFLHMLHLVWLYIAASFCITAGVMLLCIVAYLIAVAYKCWRVPRSKRGRKW